MGVCVCVESSNLLWLKHSEKTVILCFDIQKKKIFFEPTFLLASEYPACIFDVITQNVPSLLGGNC